MDMLRKGIVSSILTKGHFKLAEMENLYCGNRISVVQRWLFTFGMVETLQEKENMLVISLSHSITIFSKRLCL